MHKKSIYLLGCCFILLLAACQASDNSNVNTNKMDEETSDNTDTYPLTLSIDEKEVTITDKPEKMIPLSLEVAEIILDLVDAENVVAATRGLDDPLLSSKSDIASSIDGRIQAASNIEAEEIIAYDTDLLVMTKMYGQEEDAEKTLGKLDIPILSFEPFVTWDDFIQAYTIIGEAIDEKEQAEENIEQMDEEIANIQKKIDDTAEPTVLVLSEVGGDIGPLMMGPSNISYDLIQLAGGKPAVDDIGLTRSTPASMEQIMKMNPDYILFADFFGKGEEGFSDLLADKGWQTLDAVQNEQTMILDAKYVINPNPDLIDGLEQIVNWLYE